jgi:DNA-binding MarR family transcriptional regulator
LWVLQAILDCGCSSQTELSAVLWLDPAAVSRLVDKLVEDKLVKRSEGADRRSVQLEVTAAGRKELQILHGAQEELDGLMLAALNAAERKQLSALLATVSASLEETETASQPQPRARARALPTRRPTALRSRSNI